MNTTHPATSRLVRTFGALAALAAAEHGLGEILHRTRSTDAPVILSWPDTRFFRVLGGEPALSLLPGNLWSGLATLGLSAALLTVALAGQGRHQGRMIAGLALALLLVGGGFGPPLLALVVAALAARAARAARIEQVDREARRPAHRPGRLARATAGHAGFWYGVALLAWLTLLPGVPLLDLVVPVPDAALLLVIAAAFGALGLAGAAAVGSDRPAANWHTTPAPADRDGVLVAYASRYGATREVAEFVGKDLERAGFTVDVRPADEVDRIDGYRAVVLGAPFYLGRWLPQAHEFLARHRGELGGLPVAVFALGPLDAGDDETAAEQLTQALAQHPLLHPVATATFGGRFDAGVLRLPDRLLTAMPASPLHGLDRTDRRDWTVIAHWAAALEPALSLPANNHATDPAATSSPR